MERSHADGLLSTLAAARREKVTASPDSTPYRSEASVHSESAKLESPAPSTSSPLPVPDQLAQLRKKVADLTASLKEAETKCQRMSAEYRANLSTVFTDQQVSVLLDSTRPCPWHDETTLRALQLRTHLSSKQYQFLRESGIPLPCNSTLMTRPKKFVLKQADTGTIPAFLQTYLQYRPDRERPCLLVFDEMKWSELDLNGSHGDDRLLRA